MPERWSAISEFSDYEAESLHSEGFIHCSFANQLDVVLDRYYKNAGNVLILEIDTDKLLSRMVEEQSTNNEIYPHIYGPINHNAIVGVEEKEV